MIPRTLDCLQDDVEGRSGRNISDVFSVFFFILLPVCAERSSPWTVTASNRPIGEDSQIQLDTPTFSITDGRTTAFLHKM